jgi:LPPG:FO 2-phospho-L-lactate transferase
VPASHRRCATYRGPGRLTVVANLGDDLDSVTYSLAGLWDPERGWGLKDETFRVRDALAGLREPPWFNVGDRDLALHGGVTSAACSPGT